MAITSSMRRTIVFSMLGVFFTGILIAQQPARDAAPRPTIIGTAVITGVVVVDEPDGKPIRRATITLNPAGGFTGPRMTATDDAGRFVFSGLAAGNYLPPRVTKGAFVDVVYGQKRPGGVGTPITLVDGQRLAINFKMTRAGVISGLVFDHGGVAQPTSVSASPVRVVNGQRVPTQSISRSASSDDRGMYRISGLPPGDYVVTASSRLGSGPGGELRPISPEEIKWAKQQLQGSGGATATAAGSGPGAPAPKPLQAVTYAPIYYPGSTDLAQAGIVSVVAGKERSGVDFNLQFVPTSRIEGVVIDPDGQPALNPQINLVMKTDEASMLDPMFMMDMMMMSSRPVVVDGKFTMVGVRPGQYTVAVRAASRAAAGRPAPSGRAGGPAPMTLWATADVSVDGSDVSGLELRLAPGMELSGRIAFEGSTLQPPADLSRVSVRLSSAPSSAGVTVSINVPAAQVKPDGTFTFEGVTPGRYFLASSAPSGTPGPAGAWFLKSARIGNVDAADTPFEILPSQNIGDVVVTFTDKTSELSGTLLDAAGHPTSEFSVMLFTTDKSMWSNRSRRLRPPARAGADGKFRFANLLPGEYYLAALTDFEPGDVYKPEFLEQVAAVATKVVLGEGEKKLQDLKIAGGAMKLVNW